MVLRGGSDHQAAGFVVRSAFMFSSILIPPLLDQDLSRIAVLTLKDLPPANTDRWVIRRKAEVVAAVRGGLISLEDALAKYRLTAEEFLAWQKAIDKWGMQGLRTTRIQSYRS